MTDDILAQAEEFQEWIDRVKASGRCICDKCEVEGWREKLLAKAKRLQETIDHQQNIIADLRKNSDPKAVSDLRRR